MLLIEFLLLSISVLYVAFSRSANSGMNKQYIIGILALLIAVHLLFEGYRWQMLPTYIIWGIALITAFRQSDQSHSATLISRILKITGLILLFIPAVLLPLVFPVFELPETTGAYAVGTTDILFEADREEVITADPSDTRKFMIKAWYPSKDHNGEQDPYIDPAGRAGFAQKYGLPPSMFHYLDRIETNVYRNNFVAAESFPVLIFSHGYHSRANGYYALLSEIASQGYIVFAINHTYESTGTTFPDGTKVYFDNQYARTIESNTWETINPVVDAFKEGMDFDERHPIVQKALTTYFAGDIIERWTRDIIDVIDALDEWNQSGLFEGRLNISEIGVLGHSRGGGAAGEALLTDDRIKAGANLDGVQWGQIVNTAFQKPFLFLSSDWPKEHEDLNQHAYVNRSRSIFYEATLLESGHSNFMDIPYMIPVQALNLAGDIDRDLAIEISNKLTVSFFDKYLKNLEADLSKLAKEYDNLEMNIYTGDSMQVISKAIH